MHMKSGRGPYLPDLLAGVSVFNFHFWQTASLSNLRKTVHAEIGA
jgi:hypothetical protein